MNSTRLIIGLGAALLFAPACTSEGGASAPTASNPAVAFDALEVASDFTFATRRGVHLSLQPNTPQVAQYVEISDDEGRRLFAGAVLGSTELDFDIPNGAQPILNVRVGRGAQAVSQVVRLEGGLGTASF